MPASTPQPSSQPEPPALKPLATIVLAFIAAIAVGGVAVLLIQPATGDPDLARIAPLVVGMLAVSECFVFLGVLEPQFRRQASSLWKARSSDEQGVHSILTVYRQRVLMGSAFATGVGIAGAVLAYVAASPVLLIACPLAIIALILLFPTQARLQAYVQKAAQSSSA